MHESLFEPIAKNKKEGDDSLLLIPLELFNPTPKPQRHIHVIMYI